jgi:EAL and modified HD-GYP domain-containing signal transduction protein
MRQLNDDAELEEIERTFRKHVSLTYKLLLLVNSVGVGTRSKISTVRHGISMLGRQQIKRWVQLALFAGDVPGGTENPLLEMAAVRACIMEELAKQHITLKKYPDSAEKAHMTGILSILEATYDIPMADIVCNLNLSEDIKDALLSHTGDLGKLLHVAELLEQLEFKNINTYLDEMGITTEIMIEIQKKAYAWRSNYN